MKDGLLLIPQRKILCQLCQWTLKLRNPNLLIFTNQSKAAIKSIEEFPQIEPSFLVINIMKALRYILVIIYLKAFLI